MGSRLDTRRRAEGKLSFEDIRELREDQAPVER
jgi:hypothetical protein